jgi:hypothetical protein
MKKTEYKTPELEVIKLNAPVVLQAGSDGTTTTPVIPTEPTGDGPVYDD